MYELWMMIQVRCSWFVLRSMGLSPANVDPIYVTAPIFFRRLVTIGVRENIYYRS
jgi:putative alpha-1,2-mannosidase